jgi:hypothetical protein
MFLSSRRAYRPPTPPDDDEMRQVWLRLEPLAPLSWPIEACFIAADTALRAYGLRYRGWRMLARVVPVALATAEFTSRVRVPMERRRARELGLTLETAPEPHADFIDSLAPALMWGAYTRAGGYRAEEQNWQRYLAQRIVREIDRRRSWRRSLPT